MYGCTCVVDIQNEKNNVFTITTVLVFHHVVINVLQRCRYRMHGPNVVRTARRWTKKLLSATGLEKKDLPRKRHRRWCFFSVPTHRYNTVYGCEPNQNKRRCQYFYRYDACVSLIRTSKLCFCLVLSFPFIQFGDGETRQSLSSLQPCQ